MTKKEVCHNHWRRAVLNWAIFPGLFHSYIEALNCHQWVELDQLWSFVLAQMFICCSRRFCMIFMIRKCLPRCRWIAHFPFFWALKSLYAPEKLPHHIDLYTVVFLVQEQPFMQHFNPYHLPHKDEVIWALPYYFLNRIMVSVLDISFDFWFSVYTQHL